MACEIFFEIHQIVNNQTVLPGGILTNLSVLTVRRKDISPKTLEDIEQRQFIFSQDDTASISTTTTGKPTVTNSNFCTKTHTFAFGFLHRTSLQRRTRSLVPLNLATTTPTTHIQPQNKEPTPDTGGGCLHDQLPMVEEPDFQRASPSPIPPRRHHTARPLTRHTSQAVP